MPGFVGDNPGKTDLHSLSPSNTIGMGQRDLLPAARGCPAREYDAMPMRRTIGISLACLVTSACAIAEAPEESTTHYPGESAGATPGSAETPTDKPRSFTCEAAQERAADHGIARVERRRPSFEPEAATCDGVLDPCCGPMRAAGRSQFGKAVWYDFVGGRTASGEILDTVTATAAHRSLPLASYAKVTNLDNSRSVVVKINDRGPYTRGRIIDLSPRAADVLDMKRTGIAAVVIEPLVNQTAPTVAEFQSRGTAMAQ
jgi:rare lipoprotein A